MELEGDGRRVHRRTPCRRGLSRLRFANRSAGAVGGPDHPRRSSVREQQRRRGTGLSQRRDDRRNDRAAGHASAIATRRDRAHVGHALQGNHEAGRRDCLRAWRALPPGGKHSEDRRQKSELRRNSSTPGIRVRSGRSIPTVTCATSFAFSRKLRRPSPETWRAIWGWILGAVSPVGGASFEQSGDLRALSAGSLPVVAKYGRWALEGPDHFQTAIGLDPSYALALQRPGLPMRCSAVEDLMPIAESHPLGLRRRAAGSGAGRHAEHEAHVSVAGIIADYYWDWDKAERHFLERSNWPRTMSTPSAPIPSISARRGAPTRLSRSPSAPLSWTRCLPSFR